MGRALTSFPGGSFGEGLVTFIPPPGQQITAYFLTIHFWLPVTVLGIVPLIAAIGAWRARLAALRGCCRKCGYDLRGSEGDCPECGARRPVDAGSRGLALPVVGQADHGVRGG